MINHQPLITVIVPCYNVEKYIDRCFHSLLQQTYKNLEIIVINDASIDNTGEKCEQYAQQYPHIKVIHNFPNGGPSIARNIGLDLATGEYISCIDSDDEIAFDYFEKLYNFSIHNDCDIVICGVYKVYQKKEKEINRHSDKDTVFEKNDVMQLLFDDVIKSYVNKIYKKELWDGFRFIPGRIYEDIAIMHLIFDRAQKIGYIAEPLYYYHINDGSIESTYKPLKWMNIYFSYKERLKFAEEKYPEMASYLRGCTLNFARLTLDNYLINKEKCDEPYMNEIIERMKNGGNIIRKSRNIKWHNKLMIHFYNFSPKVYAWLINYVHRIYYFFYPNNFRKS